MTRTIQNQDRDQIDAANKRASAALNFDALLENSSEGILLVSPHGKILYAAQATERILGFNQKEILSQSWLSLIHPKDFTAFKPSLKNVFSQPGQAVHAPIIRLKHKNGSWRYLDPTLTNKLSEASVGGIIINFTDVTENVHAEEKWLYANRLYSFISQLNQAIVHAKNEEALFSEVCRIAMDQGHFEFAWVGLQQSSAKEMRLVSSCGAIKSDRAFFTAYSYDAQGPIDKVMNGKDYYVLADISKRHGNAFFDYANQRGFKSAISLALKKSGATIGTFNLYSSQKHFFREEEISLLKEATDDLSFALDVFEKESQRDQALKNLYHSQQRLKQSQAIAHLGSWEVNFKTGVAIWSDEMLKIYGLAPNESLQSYKSWIAYVHPEDVGFVKETIKNAEKSAAITAFYHRIIRSDGSMRYLYCQAQYEFDAQQNPTGFHGVAHDVTERKITERSKIQSEKNLRQIVDSIPQAVFVKDYNGRFLFVNKNFAAHFGLQPKEMIRKTFKEMLPENNSSDVMLASDREVMLSGLPQVIPDFHFINSQGQELIFQVTKMPYITAGKSLKAILCIALDVTEQKRADAERSEMVSEIVSRNKNLEQFSYIVSHNLRAPVANIIGLIEELTHESHTADLKEMLTRELSASALKIDQIILDLNQILAVREIRERSEKVSLELLVNDIRLSILDVITREKVAIRMDFTEVPEILTVKSYLYSIFYNLIANSIKFHRPGIPAQIELSSLKFKDKVVLCIKDHGAGIDLATKKNQVFGLYKRFHPHIEGKGMGLFMVKTQVEALGGKITVKSKINQGTVFLIELPL